VKNNVCRRCVMDHSDPQLIISADGICSHCIAAESNLRKYVFSAEEENANLVAMVSRVQKRRKGQYDSIIGLSGGVDSSYIAYLAKTLNLNPLCVHFDNGWNSDVAVRNIRKIIDVTGFDLFTYVIDWPEFRDLQRSFIKAGVVDIEMVTDHAIFSTLFSICRQRGISSVLSGTNYVTEHGMPCSWIWNKMDLTNIKDIHRRFGECRIRSFPTMGTLKWLMIRQFGFGGHFEEPLNSINYRKKTAMDVLKNEFGWEYYGGKHYESIFTKFYQAHILPEKFLIDKRKVHYSALIRTGEMSREEVVKELNIPLYDRDELKIDKQYVLKKLGFSEAEFDVIMNSSPVPHEFYKSDQKLINVVKRIAQKIGINSKSRS
jgi:N-acetyl sugar amidotransferase